jgi:hypothetical protein
MHSIENHRFEVPRTWTMPDRSVSFTTLLLFVATILAAAILTSCSKKAVDGDRTFRIAGTVIDLANSKPIDSAKVGNYQYNAHFDSTYTDSTGTFTFVFLTGGEPLESIRVVVSKEGYALFDTLIVRLDGNLTGWIVGLQKVSNIEQWDWRNDEYKDMSGARSSAGILRKDAITTPQSGVVERL